MADRAVRDPLAVADLVVALGAAADEQEVAAAAAVDDPAAEVGLDPVVAAPGEDGVPAVGGVDEVASGTAVDAVVLARTGPQQDLLDGIIGQIRSLPGVTRALPAPLLRSASEAADQASATPRPFAVSGR